MAVSYHGGAAENRTGSEKYISIFLQEKKKSPGKLIHLSGREDIFSIPRMDGPVHAK